MKLKLPGYGITLAILLSFSGGAADRLKADGIEATSEGTPIELSAQELGDSIELKSGEKPGGDLLRVVASKKGLFHLFDIEAPVIDSDGYAVAGEVRYQGVTEDSFLEMWNHVPAEDGDSTKLESFYSRTMDYSGPLGKLSGDSDWRVFRLPAFINDGSGRRPVRLTLNVVMEGEGTVEVRGLELQTIATPKMISRFPFVGVIGLIIGIAFVLGAAIVGLLMFGKKRRSESELRRIQALDS